MPVPQLGAAAVAAAAAAAAVLLCSCGLRLAAPVGGVAGVRLVAGAWPVLVAATALAAAAGWLGDLSRGWQDSEQWQEQWQDSERWQEEDSERWQDSEHAEGGGEEAAQKLRKGRDRAVDGIENGTGELGKGIGKLRNGSGKSGGKDSGAVKERTGGKLGKGSGR